MGHVDRLDKNVALSRIRLKRCLKRYHRAIFVWYLAIILNNVMVLFALLCADIDDLMKAKESAGIGYKHWFQLELGSSLIEHGLQLAREEKLSKAVVMVPSFCRLVLAKLRTTAMRQPVATCSLQQVRRSGTVCQLQQVRVGRRKKRKRGPGRPKKRKRGPGRPSSSSSSSSSPPNTPTPPLTRQVCTHTIHISM